VVRCAAKNIGEEVASMIWGREEHKDLFWAGFIAGAVTGGVLGSLLASDVAREARTRVGYVATGVRDRISGTTRVSSDEKQSQVDVESPI
jgi:uncharacterized protein YcfJ